MSFCRTVPSAGDFTPLFRLLDDYDTHYSTKRACSTRTFTPRFDVRETTDAYHLDGELPGLAQKDIDIEFSDSQTLVIKGRSEREFRPQSEDSSDATVTPETSDDENQETQAHSDSDKKESQSKPRYWVSERAVGEFKRTFSFATRVDQDAVRAALKHGILSIVVPKAAMPTKKITIE